VGGILITCAETTAWVIGERRLRTLRDLAGRTADARTVREACDVALATLAQNPADLPAVALDLLEPGGSTSARWGTAGDAGLLPPPDLVRSLGASDRVVVVPGTSARPEVLVLPVTGAGYLAVAASPRRPLDDSYRGFFELLSGHLAGAIANARAYEEAQQRAQALAELDRAKTAFFSNVSHEFRTPLNLLLGPLEDALADSAEPLGERQRERLSLAHRNGLRLLRLVNTLLEFTRLESGRVDAAFEPTDLAAFTADLASGFRSAAERAGLELIVECPHLPAPVYVDRDMWEKIVLNLLSNALKFTLAGEGELERIAQEIEHDLFPHVPVDVHRRGQVRALDDELEAGALGRRPEPTGEVRRERREIGGLERRVHPAGFEPGELEQRIDQAEQPETVPVGQREPLPLALAERLGRIRQGILERAQQQVERRAKLVAHVREERGLGAVQLGQRLRPLLGLLVRPGVRDGAGEMSAQELEEAAVGVVERPARAGRDRQVPRAGYRQDQDLGARGRARHDDHAVARPQRPHEVRRRQQPGVPGGSPPGRRRTTRLEQVEGHRGQVGRVLRQGGERHVARLANGAGISGAAGQIAEGTQATLADDPRGGLGTGDEYPAHPA